MPLLLAAGLAVTAMDTFDIGFRGFQMPLVVEWSQFAALKLLDRTVIKDMSVLSFDVTWMVVQLSVGILLLILAEVFAAGIGLREDVESLM